jgi:hypothetical protein
MLIHKLKNYMKTNVFLVPIRLVLQLQDRDSTMALRYNVSYVTVLSLNHCRFCPRWQLNIVSLMSRFSARITVDSVRGGKPLNIVSLFSCSQSELLFILFELATQYCVSFFMILSLNHCRFRAFCRFLRLAALPHPVGE